MKDPAKRDQSKIGKNPLLNLSRREEKKESEKMRKIEGKSLKKNPTEDSRRRKTRKSCFLRRFNQRNITQNVNDLIVEILSVAPN